MSLYHFFYAIYSIRLWPKKLDWYYERIFRRLVNSLLPVYFILTKSFKRYRLSINTEEIQLHHIVSLTTFPARIHKVWLTIESILRQDVKPDAIILWLHKGEFPDKTQLPKNLLAQEKRGLQIRFCEENLMPHKKYYYTLKENPQANIITIDDDTFFPPDLIKKMINQHLKSPNEILCFRAREIKTDNGTLKPYKTWNYVKENSTPRTGLLPIGVGSVLYPPGSLNDDVFDIDMLKKLALRADDLWLKVMGLLNNSRVICMGAMYKRFFMPVRIKNNIKLEDENVVEGKNDVIFKNLLAQYRLNPNLFKDIPTTN